MPILDQSKLNEANRKFRAEFQRALGDGTRWTMDGATRIVTRVPVTGPDLKTKFAVRMSGVSEWIDERQKKGVRIFDLSAEVKKWESSLQIPVDALEDDQSNLALYADEIASMAEDFNEHKHQLIIDLIANGFDASKGTVYDGQFLFDSDHQDGPDGPVQSNVDTAAFSAVALHAGMAAMSKIKKSNGFFAGIRATHGIFPEALRGTVEAIVDRQYQASGASNELYKRVQPIFDPRLDDVSTTAWFLADLSKPIKPFVMADRKSVQFRAKTNPTGEVMFDRDIAEWGGDGRYNATHYFWQLLWGSDGTV